MFFENPCESVTMASKETVDHRVLILTNVKMDRTLVVIIKIVSIGSGFINANAKMVSKVKIVVLSSFLLYSNVFQSQRQVQNVSI